MIVAKTLHIEQASLSDVEAVRHLAERAYASYIPVMNARPLPMDADYAARIGRGDVWLVRSEKDDLHASLTLTHEADHLGIYSIAVDPAAQGEGYGRKMLDFACQRAKDLGYAEVQLFTNVLMIENRAWYQRNGFLETYQEQRGDKLICHMTRTL
ncbi:MAG: GNAT family N-acetyltransferase [Roseibium sp.]